ncbi:MAG: discoidin domain-containing protein [Trichodesmium sp. MAG_R04]|jgi:hypothetical protein|nr:discoidin domain-containing protein [Trichodesmium sp. MAG_R04]
MDLSSEIVKSQKDILRHNFSKSRIIKVCRIGHMQYNPFSVKVKNYGARCKEFMRYGIILTDDQEDCDVFVSMYFDELAKISSQYNDSKKYLLWTHEPRFDTNFTKKVSLQNNVDIHIMNVYTGDAYENNYAYTFWLKSILEPVSYNNFSRPKYKKIAMIATYKENQPLVKDGINIDLCKLRTEIALRGHEFGCIDIYGPGWPENIATNPHQEKKHPHLVKLDILNQYHFNLCFENTNFKHYCTEKIWHSLIAGCLPIYYGKGNAIYDDFPKSSFLDYSDFNSPDVLMDYINNMDIKEFNLRMNLCLEVANNIYTKKNWASTRLKRLHSIISKLQTITGNKGEEEPIYEISLEEIIPQPSGQNIALNKPAQQSSYSKWSQPNESSRAVNGLKNGGYSFCTGLEVNPWWQVDLENTYTITQVRIYNRCNNSSAERARTLTLLFSTDGNNWEQVYSNDEKLVPGGINGQPLIVSFESKIAGYVRIQLNEKTYLHLDEIEVYGSAI